MKSARRPGSLRKPTWCPTRRATSGPKLRTSSAGPRGKRAVLLATPRSEALPRPASGCGAGCLDPGLGACIGCSSRLPDQACGPHSGTPGGVSICLPEPSTEGRRRATDAAILLVFLRVRARLRCAGVPSTISPTELQGNTSSWLLEAIRCSQDVQCMDNRTPTADTLRRLSQRPWHSCKKVPCSFSRCRCGHYGAWVGQLHCLEEADPISSVVVANV